MDTFKQIMGFVLLGTVVYIFTFLDLVLYRSQPWIADCLLGRMLVDRANAALCRTSERARLRFEAADFVGIVWIFLFPGIKGITKEKVDWGSLHEVMSSRLEEKFDWQIAKYLDSSKRRATNWSIPAEPSRPLTNRPGLIRCLIDFTADWCANCKFLEATVLHSEPVRKKLEENGVVLMKGDCTNYKEVNDANDHAQRPRLRRRADDCHLSREIRMP